MRALLLYILSCFLHVLWLAPIRHGVVFGFSSGAVPQGPPLPVEVVCVGDSLFDCIAIERGTSVKEMIDDPLLFEAYAGGATANVATAICKLGIKSAWVGCMGDDQDGHKLKDVLSSTGVNTDYVQQTQHWPTRRVMVTRNKDTGDREFGGFWNNLPAGDFADCYLDDKELFPDVLTNLMDEVKWLVCGTLGLAFPTTAASTRRLIESSITGGKNKQEDNDRMTTTNLLVDVNWRPVFWKDSGYSETEARHIILEFIQDADVLKMTDEEVEWLTGIPAVDALADPVSVHKSFPNAKAVLVTAGEKGASYSMLGGGFTGYSSVMPVDVVETTGAGDAFTAGFLQQIITRKLDIAQLDTASADNQAICDEIVQFASAVGGLTCTGNGAIPAQPHLRDVESFLATLPQEKATT